VTRAAQSRDKALASLFASDADAAILRVLRDAGRALSAGEVQRTLREAGVAGNAAYLAWESFRKKVPTLGHIEASERRYRWRDLSAAEALDLLLTTRPRGTRREELAAIVRGALIPPDADPAEAARARQTQIDAVRALAELASEVEELTANEVGPDVLIRRVRARVKRNALEPIERAGAATRFDRKRHRAIAGSIREGAPVMIVRPGYLWKTPAEEVLIHKATVEE
jgi:hypothetical protein